jgi:hypothetical protein
MTNKDKDIIRLARQSGATETYTRMIFETILEEQRTLEEPAQGLHRTLQMPYNTLISNQTYDRFYYRPS